MTDKILIERAVIEQALEALNSYTTPGALGGRVPIDLSLVIKLQAALATAEQPQEPVAVVAPWPDYVDWLRDEPPVGTKLYTHPAPKVEHPAQKKAFGNLTYEEVKALISGDPPTIVFGGPKVGEQMLNDLVKQPAQGGLTGCACRWDANNNRVSTCTRHQGWLDVVSEWAERAKAAEAAYGIEQKGGA